MNNIRAKLLLLILSASCVQKNTQQVLDVDSTSISRTQTIEPSPDLFSDSYFTFLDLDSLNEEMLRDTTVKRDYKYIESVKRFTEEHCKFFKTGCTDSFFDEHVFLVSKQKKIGEILPIIIHDSKDFNYYHSDLYTLDKNYKKIDSLRVSTCGSGTQSDEPSIYYETIVFTKFQSNKLITTEIEYWHYADNDSTVTKDSTIFYQEIMDDGKIKLLKKDKLL